jgi:hypothetical protein
VRVTRTAHRGSGSANARHPNLILDRHRFRSAPFIGWCISREWQAELATVRVFPVCLVGCVDASISASVLPMIRMRNGPA